jgi:hypothetical protein
MNKQEIEKIKNNLNLGDNPFGGLVSQDDLKELNELKKKSYSDSLYLGLLYFECHNILQEKKSIEGIDSLLDKYKLSEELHKLIESRKTTNYGTFYIEKNIRKYVIEHKKDMSEFVSIFFDISKNELEG